MFNSIEMLFMVQTSGNPREPLGGSLDSAHGEACFLGVILCHAQTCRGRYFKPHLQRGKNEDRMRPPSTNTVVTSFTFYLLTKSGFAV